MADDLLGGVGGASVMSRAQGARTVWMIARTNICRSSQGKFGVPVVGGEVTYGCSR